MAMLGKRSRTKRTTTRSRKRTRMSTVAAPVRRFIRPSFNPVHSFRRRCQFASIIGNAAYSPYLAGYTFTLNALPGVSDFTTLYDQYRINMIVLKFYLRKDPGADTAVNAIYPRMWWAIDRDDTTIPASLNELRERGNVRTAVLSQFRPVTIKFVPNTLAVQYVSAVASTYEPKYKSWVDISSVATPFYGLKWGIDNLTITSQVVDVEATYYFQCKNTR